MTPASQTARVALALALAFALLAAPAQAAYGYGYGGYGSYSTPAYGRKLLSVDTHRGVDFSGAQLFHSGRSLLAPSYGYGSYGGYGYGSYTGRRRLLSVDSSSASTSLPSSRRNLLASYGYGGYGYGYGY